MDESSGLDRQREQELDPELRDNLGILELGAGRNPDPRSTTLCDIKESTEIDVSLDLNDTPWPFGDESADGIIMHHVMEHLEEPTSVMNEIGRILKPEGWAEITVPIGALQERDPTHKQFWNYHTPEYFALNEPAPETYDFETPPLELVDRSYSSLWWTLPGLSKASVLLRAVANRWPGVWVDGTPWIAGSLTIRYERCMD